MWASLTARWYGIRTHPHPSPALIQALTLALALALALTLTQLWLENHAQSHTLAELGSSSPGLGFRVS